MAIAEKKPNIAERIYQDLRQLIFDFQLLPGERFSEKAIAEKMQASRTPVREALYRLERDGYVLVHFRSGWQVRPFDFQYFENLYEVRTLLETEAVKRLCAHSKIEEVLKDLIKAWCCPESERESQDQVVAQMDEDFHFMLVEQAGNPQLARVHRDICEKLRIIRRLDFTQPNRITATYQEHNEILQFILQKQEAAAVGLLSQHIEASKNTVRSITLHRIQAAKQEFLLNAHQE